MMKTQSPQFGSLLQRYRVAAGLTQEELAERAGISPRAISALERGVNQAPRKATLTALAQALPLTAAERASFEVSGHARPRATPPLPPATLPHVADIGDRGASTPEFVGRATEVAILERHVQGDGPPVAFIVGEPGIGKSRLLHEVGSRARSAGMRVVVGKCLRYGAQDPYAPLLDAIAQCVDGLTPRERGDLLGDACWLARLLPELADAGVIPKQPSALAPAQERRLMFQAVMRLCMRVAEPQGLLLLLDDLQWAGPDALEMLVSLAMAVRDTRVRIVAAYRNTEQQTGTPLADALAECADNGLALSRELGPLDHLEAEALLGHVLSTPLPGGQADALLRRTGGVPFFLVHCARDVQAGHASEGRAAAPPWSITQSVRQRVARLPAAAQQLLPAMALLGTPASLALLQRLGERLRLTASEVQQAIDAACHDGLLVEQQHTCYQFAHELMREVVEAEVGSASAVALHRWIAECLEATGDTSVTGAVAYQYIRGGQWDRAAAHLERAGDQAMAARAIAEAAALFAELAAGLDSLGRATWAAAVREKLAAALVNLARYDEALDALYLALATHRAERDAPGVMRAAARVGEAQVLRGTPQAGLDLVAALVAADAEDASPSPDAAPAYAAYAWLLNACGRYAEALSVAERAAQLARAGSDATAVIQADLRRGQLLLMLGDLDAGARVLHDVLPLAEAAGDLRSLRQALNSLGWIHEARGEFAEDERYTEHSFRIAERLGDPTVLAFMTSNRGGPPFNLGRWQQARNLFAAGLALMRPLGPTWASAWPPLLLGRLELAEGKLEAAHRLLEDAIELATRSGDLQALRWAHTALAEDDLLSGRPQAAHDRLLPLLDRPDQRESDVCPLLPLLAWACLDLGDLACAETVVQDAIERATASGMRPALVSARRVRALLRQRREQWVQAEADLATALSESRRMGHAYGQGIVRYEQGRLASRTGDIERARTCLESAHQVLAELGERLYGDRVGVLLAGPCGSEPARQHHVAQGAAKRARSN